MGIIRIDENNLWKYGDYIEPDAAEELKRYYHRGVVITDEDSLPLGYAVWEYRHMETEEPLEAHICYFFAEDNEAADALISSYTELIRDDGAVKSFFRLPINDMEKYKGCFERAGFRVSVAEGEYLRLTIRDFLSLPFLSECKREKVKALNQIKLRFFRQEMCSFASVANSDLLSELKYLPFNWYELDISCFSVSHGRPDGFMLVHELPSGSLHVEILRPVTHNLESLINLMGFCMNESVKKYSEDTEVIMRKNDQFSVMLANYLFPDKKQEKVLYGEYSHLLLFRGTQPG